MWLASPVPRVILQEFALEADQPARRNPVLEARAALAVGLHVLQVAATPAQFFHHATLMGVLDVDRQQLIGFLPSRHSRFS